MSNTRKKLQERDSGFSKNFLKGVEQLSEEGNPEAKAIIKKKPSKREEKSVTASIEVTTYKFLMEQRYITEKNHKEADDLRSSSVTGEAKNCIEFCREMAELLGDEDYRTAIRKLASKKKGA